jgi:hypothetical protein
MRHAVPGDRDIATMLYRCPLLLAFLLPLPALAQTPLAVPVSAIWAGEWRVADSNLPPASKALTTRRDPKSFEVRALIGGAECPLAYDGQLRQADVIRRIEERAQWQLKPDNWPAGTDPAQFVGLKKEFEQALRLARSLPPDTYRRVRATCPTLPQTDDRFYLLNDGRRLFEFRFPDNGLSVSATVYERVR